MTAETPRAPLSAAVLEAAADWMDRYDTLSPGERAALQAWLAESEQNRRAFAAMESALLDDALREAVERVRTAPKPATAPAPEVSSRTHPRPAPWLRALQIGLPMAAAAAGIAVFSPALLHAPLGSQPPRDRSIEYATPVGVRADAALKDHSMVHLDAASAVRVSFTRSARDVRLERGEAMFEVAHDPARPFDVHAGGATVTAVGTIFDVERLDDAVNVHVYQGVVRVRSAGGDVRLLHAGEQLAMGAGARPAVARRFSPDISQTWRSDWLQADNTPLRQVVARLNRYSQEPVILKSEGLSDIALSGRFDLRRTDATITMISALLGLDVVRDGRAIYLARRPLRG
jgi:transmembrane sensor